MKSQNKGRTSFSKHWKNGPSYFPMFGKMGLIFSNVWKNRVRRFPMFGKSSGTAPTGWKIAPYCFLLVLGAGPAQGTNGTFTVMAANLSGPSSTYGEPARRIFQGLKPDIVTLHEWNITNASYRAFVDLNFGTNYYYYVESEPSDTIPNGIVSRWPMTASGEWADRIVPNRDFAWATIELPGPRDIHVVAVHLKSGSTTYDKRGRQSQARALINYIRRANWPASDFLVIAGDLNVQGRLEGTVLILTNVVSDSRQPADQNGNKATNIPRNQEFDFVLPNPLLNAGHVAVVVNGVTFHEGMVFDSRLWPSPPPPIQPHDSETENLQHLCVMKRFLLPDH